MEEKEERGEGRGGEGERLTIPPPVHHGKFVSDARVVVWVNGLENHLVALLLLLSTLLMRGRDGGYIYILYICLHATSRAATITGGGYIYLVAAPVSY